jgi:hypothetical protein
VGKVVSGFWGAEGEVEQALIVSNKLSALK